MRKTNNLRKFLHDFLHQTCSEATLSIFERLFTSTKIKNKRIENTQPVIAKRLILKVSKPKRKLTVLTKLFPIQDDIGKKKNGKGQFKQA